MTLDGWRRLEDLKAGDRLAVPRRVSEPLHIQRMADDEVALLAHMIGDESCVKNQPIRYASIDEDNLSAVTQAARHFGVSGQTRRPSGASHHPAAARAPLSNTRHLTHGRRNPSRRGSTASVGSASPATTSSCRRNPSRCRTSRSPCSCAICGRRIDAPNGTQKENRVGSTTPRQAVVLRKTSGNPCREARRSSAIAVNRPPGPVDGPADG
jgi:hypothetical protein